MAGPSTVGTLGLDIGDFDKAWHSAIANINQLEPELKQANAALKLMERNFRGAAAGATISAKAIERQKKVVASLTAELKAEKSELSAFQEATGKGENKGGGFLGKLAGIGAIGAIGSFATSFLTAGRNANELTKQLDDMDMSGYADELSDADKEALKFKGTLLDLAGAASSIPLVGKLFESVLSPVKLAADAVQSYREASIAMNKEASTTEELLQKLNRLEFERAKIIKESVDADGARQKIIEGMGKIGASVAGSPVEGMFDTIRVKREEQLAGIEATRAQVALRIAQQAQAEAKARSGILSGSEKESQLGEAELQRQQKSAAIIETVKNKFGGISGPGRGVNKVLTNTLLTEQSAQNTQIETAYGLQLTLLRLQTQATEAQLRGMHGVAEQANIVAKFDKEIVAQLLAGNKEAADLLKRQKEIALVQERAVEHDVTPRQRRESAREFRITQRKAKQQEDREEAIRRQMGHEGAGGGLDKLSKKEFDSLRRKDKSGRHYGTGLGTEFGGLDRRDKDGNIIEGGLNAPIPRSRRIQEQQLKDRNSNDGAMRQARAAADVRALQQQMMSITGDLKSIAGAIKSDK